MLVSIQKNGKVKYMGLQIKKTSRKRNRMRTKGKRKEQSGELI